MTSRPEDSTAAAGQAGAADAARARQAAARAVDAPALHEELAEHGSLEDAAPALLRMLVGRLGCSGAAIRERGRCIARTGARGVRRVRVPIADGAQTLALLELECEDELDGELKSALDCLGQAIGQWIRRREAENVLDELIEDRERERDAALAQEAALERRASQLAGEVADAEERERRRLADGLHDDVLQSLLATRLELSSASGGEAARARAVEALDRALDQLREAVFEFHPVTLATGGLELALEATVARQARRASLEHAVTVDARAVGFHDQLILGVARELVANAAKHARADSVSVTVTRRGDEVLVEVRDDGTGMDAGRLSAALADGHVGLASCRTRVEALGGRLDVSTGADGTSVRAVLPSPDPPVGG